MSLLYINFHILYSAESPILNDPIVTFHRKLLRRRLWWKKPTLPAIINNSTFGVVRYERTYYRHKESGRYAYLVDEEVGYTPHMRVDRNVKAKLVERAGDMAYRKAAMEAS